MAGQPQTPPRSLGAGLRCRCPRCGEGALFKGALTLDINPTCDKCGLDLRFIDSGDGPAVFAILILGAVVLGLALVIESRFSPPFWVHVVLWGPITLGLAFGMLRPLKGILIAQQFKHKAGEMSTARNEIAAARAPRSGHDNESQPP